MGSAGQSTTGATPIEVLDYAVSARPPPSPPIRGRCSSAAVTSSTLQPLRSGFGAGFGTGPLHAAVAHPAAITPLMGDVGRFFPAVYDETAPLRVDGRWQVRINALLDPDL